MGLPFADLRCMILTELHEGAQRMSDQPMDDQSGTDRQPPPDRYRSGAVDGGRSPDELNDELGDASPVLVRAEAHLRSPLLDAPPPPLRQDDNGDRIPSIEIPEAIRPYAVDVIAIAIAVSLAANAGLGLTAGVITAAAIAMRSVGRRVAFGFGDGFMAFRQGNDWPHGVQEEYDVHYSLPSTARVSPGR
jgi:hypothetical protein